ncbi:MAG: DUF2335 domain-containing protein [Bryobacteraceae bacterium]
MAVGVFSGPLPHPQVLEGYESVCQGAANRIIELAEAQSAHRRRMEEREVEAQIEGMRAQFSEARLGQVFAFCVSIAFMGCGAAVVIWGHSQAVGSVFGVMGVSGIVGTFIKGRIAKPERSQPEKPPPAAPQKRKRRK